MFFRHYLLISSVQASLYKPAMMYCVVNRFEIARLKTIVNEIDSGAFVTISEISEIIGARSKYAVSEKKKTLSKATARKNRKGAEEIGGALKSGGSAAEQTVSNEKEK